MSISRWALIGLAMATVVSLPAVVEAADASWNVDADGDWTVDGNWSDVHPNGTGETAAITKDDITAARVITLDASRTIGTLAIGDSSDINGYFGYTIGGFSSLIFDASSGNAAITKSTAGNTATDEIAVPITLLDNLVITNNGQNTSSGAIVISGSIGESEGAKNVTINKTNNASNTESLVVLSGVNTYTGTTTVSETNSTQVNVVRITNGSALGTADAGTTVARRSRLELLGDFTTAEPFFLGGQDGNPPSPRLVSLGGTNTISGDITTASGGGDYRILANGTGSDVFTISGDIRAHADDRSLFLGGTGTGVISGDIFPLEGSGINWLDLHKLDAGTWTLSGANVFTGTTTVGDGTLLINGTHDTGGNAYNVALGATLGGIGDIGTSAVNVATGGFLAPGNGVGQFSVGGAAIEGSLKIEFGNDQIDKLVVTGDLAVAGATFDFTSLGSLSEGVYPFATYTGTLTGNIGDLAAITFNGENGLPDGLELVFNSGQLALSGSFTSSLSGDFNGDHAVDGADFLVWQRQFGPATEGTTADGNHDGTVDGLDLAIWKEGFGGGVGGGASINFGSALVASVPEPASLGLLLWPALGLLLRGRRLRQP